MRLRWVLGLTQLPERAVVVMLALGLGLGAGMCSCAEERSSLSSKWNDAQHPSKQSHLLVQMAALEASVDEQQRAMACVLQKLEQQGQQLERGAAPQVRLSHA